MSNITVTLSDDRLAKLKNIAERYNVTLEDLVKVTIDEFIAQPDEAFQKAAQHILNKNSELYRRLA